VISTRVAVALGDLDGDGPPNLVLTDGYAKSSVFLNSGQSWTAAASWTPPDPGSGPGAPAVIGASQGPPCNVAPTARLSVSPASGTPPLVATLDASASSDPDHDALTLVWDFGDGTAPAPQGSVVQHSYGSPGRYLAKVTVPDAAHNGIATATKAKAN
jgi:PKD repeat protein